MLTIELDDTCQVCGRQSTALSDLAIWHDEPEHGESVAERICQRCDDWAIDVLVEATVKGE
jgi:hypothetical protein